MNNLKLAVRGVTRNKRRTLLAVGAIAVALMTMIVLNAFMDGATKQTEERVIENTGHVQLYAPGYYDESRTMPTDIAIGYLSRVLERVRGMEGVVEATARIQFGGLAVHAERELTGLFVALEPEEADRIHGYAEKIVQGRYLTDGDEDGCLVGYRFAELLGLEVGDKLTFVTQTSYGALTAADLIVVGIVATLNPAVDEAGVLLRLADAQRRLELEDAATALVVTGEDADESDELKERLLSMLNAGVELEEEPARSVVEETGGEVPLFAEAAPTGGFEAPEEKLSAPTREGFEGYTWFELNHLIFDIMNQKAQMQDIVRAVLIILAAAMIANTMLTNVFERTREIGVLMAMGAKGRQVLLVFLGEAAVLGVIGSLAGVALGAAGGLILQNVGIDLGEGVSSLMNIPMDRVFYALVVPVKLAYIFFLGVIVSILAGLYPAAKAARMLPTKALRFI